MDPLLDAIQAQLDSEGDHWQVGSYVLIVGCSRILGDEIECEAFRYIADDQPPWVTDGLLLKDEPGEECEDGLG